MPQIPSDGSLESTLALGRDPYGFISKRCRRLGSDLFQTRIQLHKTICMTGPAAAELFYDEERFIRAGAAPARMRKTLLGQRGVQTLDGAAHRHRKQMFMSLMTPGRIEQLGELTDACWRSYARRWAGMDKVVLYDEVRELLCRSVCAWAGVPLEESEVPRRTQDLTALFDEAGSVGPKHWWARFARKRSEQWIARLVEQIRDHQLIVPEETAAHAIALHRELQGQLLSPHDAAVEILNILRPTVAIAVFITQAAAALHEHPECRQKLRESGDDGYTELFVQEVRRFFPFFPAVVARVRRDFEWNGHPFASGTTVMLDLYGTNRDSRAWDAPNTFRPERFQHWDRSAFNFIPQGGGDHARHHRCAGEWITIDLMKRAVLFLAREISFDVPEQDLRIDDKRLPALPRSCFVMGGVRPSRGQGADERR